MKMKYVIIAYIPLVLSLSTVLISFKLKRIKHNPNKIIPTYWSENWSNEISLLVGQVSWSPGITFLIIAKSMLLNY